ncbi:MAG: hypothetical protein ACOYCD_02640 [Kiritimatiellia bacterium]|jgi:hypothetical protein
MADIELTCPNCAKTTSVSEYAEGPTIACPSCGTPIPLPGTQKQSRLTLRKREPAPVKEPPAPHKSATDPTMENRRQSASLKRDIKRVRRNKLFLGLSGLLFLALAAGLFHLRFRGGYAEWVTFEEFQKYELIAAGALYVLIILYALKDNMFDGLLSLVVPLYPFYYLFAKASAPFLRAVTAAVLLVFGKDLLAKVQVWANTLFEVINHWIRNA